MALLQGAQRTPDPLALTSFNDSEWQEGQGGFGFGDRDDRTSLDDMRNAYGALYLRKSFRVEDKSRLSQLLFRYRYDDAVVVYLNGEEVLRTSGLLRAGSPPAHDALCDESHEATRVLEAVDLSSHLHLLEEGENVLAVQVHNVEIDSSDLSFEGELSAYVHDFSDPFRELWASRVRRHLLGGALTSGHVMNRLDEIAATCGAAMPEFDRWKGALSIRDQWLPKRPGILLGHLRSHGLAEPAEPR